MPGLSLTETKDMTQKIMSSIIFSHYMESIVPGSFQKTMDEMYRNNGLKPMKFPTPPTTDAVRNAFHHHNMTGGTTGNMNNITPTDELTDNEDINLTINLITQIRWTLSSSKLQKESRESP